MLQLEHQSQNYNTLINIDRTMEEIALTLADHDHRKSYNYILRLMY